MRKLTNAEFIEKSKAIHGDKYDYSLVDYQNQLIKVKIICKHHSIFEQKPKDHLNWRGCPICGGTYKKYNTKGFIQKAKEIHGDKYDYSLVDYQNLSTKVKITCFEHGVFEQIADNHLRGSICPACSREIRKVYGYKKHTKNLQDKSP